MNAIVQKFEHSLALPWAFGYRIFIPGLLLFYLPLWEPVLLSLPSLKEGRSLLVEITFLLGWGCGGGGWPHHQGEQRGLDVQLGVTSGLLG